MQLDRETRQAYLSGAGWQSMGTLGRPLTQSELQAIVARYPRLDD